MAESALRALVPRPQEIVAPTRSWNPLNPAFRDTLSSAMTNMLGASNVAGREGYDRSRYADMLTGAVDFVPGAGEAAGVGDVRREVQQGNYPGAALAGVATALGVIPVIGDVAGKAVRGAGNALDMSQAARMQRSMDQNFYDRNFYHATTEDFPEFKKSKMGSGASMGTKEKAVWMSSDPDVADTYLPGQFVNRENAPHTADLGGGVGRHYMTGSQILPLRVSLDPDKISWWDMGGARYEPEQVEKILKNAKKEGMQAVAFKNIRDEGIMGLGAGKRAISLAVFDPKNIRSVNAAFDPAKRNSANLMAGVGGVLAGGSALRALLPQEQERQPD